jgi:penicillin-binding protein 1C
MTRRAFHRAALAAAVTLATPVLALVVAAALTPLPPALTSDASDVSVEVVDRGGKVIRRVRTADHALASPVRLGELSPHVVPALLAAEDSRFFRHPGVDVLSIVRALGQALFERRLVSGASTLTQQLARSTFPRPRTLRGKWQEMALALRIERSLTKAQILEKYLSRVEFGPNVRGIDAASRYYFDKPPVALDLSEAAALVSLPRGPTLYDPRRGIDRVLRRRNRVLERMANQGLVSDDAAARATATELRLSPTNLEGGMEHFALGIVGRTIPTGLPAAETYTRIETTIDSALEDEVTTLARRAAEAVRAHGASALAVLVLDNASGDVLAYVGSPDYFHAEAAGANDGVLAERQPGSTLKPFVYGTAMEDLGLTAASLLPDVELHLKTPHGVFTPKNYDGRTHGPVRMREALASSLNIPAVYVAEKVGPARVLERLHRAGFASLDEAAGHYGAAIALGDGEVQLAELSRAYAMLARGGELPALSYVKSAVTADGRRLEPARLPTTRVFDARTAAVLTDVLSDDTARAGSFGRDSALAFSFPVAAKTGTSKGYRDNWTVGYTPEVTVGVWVGNFDGSPMIHSSGVTGAAPLFHDVMVAAMRGRPQGAFPGDTGLVAVEVCALSGARPGPHCHHRVRELFRPNEVPASDCAMHVEERIDKANGLLAGPACADAEARVFEAYPERYASWAVLAQRPIAPWTSSPRCPLPASRQTGTGAASIRFPGDGAEFVLDPEGPATQEIVLAARASEGTRRLRFVLDGRRLSPLEPPFEMPWRLQAGRHRLSAQTGDGRLAEAVTFSVRHPVDVRD